MTTDSPPDHVILSAAILEAAERLDEGWLKDATRIDQAIKDSARRISKGADAARIQTYGFDGHNRIILTELVAMTKALAGVETDTRQVQWQEEYVRSWRDLQIENRALRSQLSWLRKATESFLKTINEIDPPTETDTAS